MSLSRKYRPQSLDEIYGNKAVVKSLGSVLNKKEVPPAFLFTGNSGCGKTSLARIAATQLGCTGHDFKEVDSADFRGIDTIRGIRRQMRLKSMSGIRVWLLDECHKMSGDAQSALLKALEDPPSHVYFMLATTDPQKLLKTIRNRCVHFEVQPLGNSEIRETGKLQKL